MKNKNITTTVKLLIIIAEICFLFPFVMVSCSGTSVEASGVELMTKISLHEEIEFDEDDSPNYYLLVAFALGTVGLGVVCKSKEQKKGLLYTGFFTVGSALFLLLFRSTFISFYDLKGYEGRVDIEFRWGWWLSLASYIIAGSCAFIGSQYHEQMPLEVSLDKGENAGLATTDESHIMADQIEKAGPPECPRESQSQEPVIGFEEPTIKSTLFVKLHIQYEGGSTEHLIKEFPCLIGRDSGSCEIKIEDSKVSRTHARLTVKDDAVFIEDLKSSNGTEVNGQLISGVTEVLSGDEIIIGSTRIYFEIGIKQL